MDSYGRIKKSISKTHEEIMMHVAKTTCSDLSNRLSKILQDQRSVSIEVSKLAEGFALQVYLGEQRIQQLDIAALEDDLFGVK